MEVSNQEFMDDRDYKRIKKELDPLITKVMRVAAFRDPNYPQFKKDMNMWNERFGKALEITGKVSSMQHIAPNVNPQLMSTIKMFVYLGLVEGVGVALVDLIVLLLIASGETLHVEQLYGIPRVIHARTLEDLRPPKTNANLAVKISFLQRHGLEATSKIIDTKLRNDIAHLNFDVSADGTVSTKNYKVLSIEQRLQTFGKILGIIMVILSKSQLGVKFWGAS